MKRGFYINQEALHSAGVKGVDYIDLAIFEFIATWASSGKSSKKVVSNRVYCFVQSGFIIKNMPFLSRKETITKYAIAQRVDVLVGVGLLQRHPDNQATGKTYIGLTNLADNILMRQSSDLEYINSTPLESLNSTPLVNKLDLEYRDIAKENIKQRERETHAREEEKPIVLEQPQIKNECLEKPKFTTLDIPTCEGHKIKIGVHEYPQQKQGIPFIHPDLISRIPFERRVDLWWSLYGIRQSEIKVESEMITAGLADNETFAKIYRHTFLYVAVTDERFRVPPIKYWKNRTWTDDIVDRRDKKTPTDNTGVAITNAPPAKNWIERDMDEIRRLKQWDIEENARWEKKMRLDNDTKAAKGRDAE